MNKPVFILIVFFGLVMSSRNAYSGDLNPLQSENPSMEAKHEKIDKYFAGIKCAYPPYCELLREENHDKIDETEEEYEWHEIYHDWLCPFC